MRVFVTGASGFIGSAVVPELMKAGHRVIGLARSDESARALETAGVEVHRGSLDDVESLRAGAAKSDGVIHLAFIHDFANFAASVRADLQAISTMGKELEGSNRPFVIAAGLLGRGQGRAIMETDPAPTTSPRGQSEAIMMDLATRGVRTSIMRFPPSVHGKGDKGFVPHLIATARKAGHAGYPGDGANRWPAVHRFDAARVLRLALETAPPGTVVHPVADEGIPTREIAAVIGRGLGVPVVSKSPEEYADYFGFLAHFVAFDAPASSALTRERFSWAPTELGLLEDMAANYFG